MSGTASPVPALERAPAAAPIAGAVLLHPHPAMGGNRFNHVVDALYRALPGAQVSAYRFDFSSEVPAVASSEAAAAVAAIAAEDPGRPVLVIGYSFGADIATTVDGPSVAGWFLIAPPLRIVAAAAVVAAGDPRPTGIAVPEHDQFTPPARVAEETVGWANCTTEVIAAADHFLAGATGALTAAVLAWIERPDGPLAG